MDDEKQPIIDALRTWINRRSGLDYRDYGDPASYRAELRSIQKDLHHARLLLQAVEVSGVTADELKAAFSAYSGRMEWDGKQLHYTTGQYWPTEYRRVVCAIAASALWAYKRERCMPSATGQDAYGSPLYQGVSAGEWLRKKFRKEFGKGIQERWFN